MRNRPHVNHNLQEFAESDNPALASRRIDHGGATVTSAAFLLRNPSSSALNVIRAAFSVTAASPLDTRLSVWSRSGLPSQMRIGTLPPLAESLPGRGRQSPVPGLHAPGLRRDHDRVAPALMPDDPRQHPDLIRAVGVGVSRLALRGCQQAAALNRLGSPRQRRADRSCVRRRRLVGRLRRESDPGGREGGRAIRW